MENLLLWIYADKIHMFNCNLHWFSIMICMRWTACRNFPCYLYVILNFKHEISTTNATWWGLLSAFSARGEIAAICQDVRLLKQKFDLHLPLSESLFPNQTSFFLASSNSSLEKSLVPDQVPMGDDDLFETHKNRDHELVLEEEATEDDRKALEDDGWEFYVDAETVVWVQCGKFRLNTLTWVL